MMRSPSRSERPVKPAISANITVIGRIEPPGRGSTPSLPRFRTRSAGMYFLKSAEVNLAENEWLQRAWILGALAGMVAAALTRRPQPGAAGGSSLALWLPLMFLLAPLPFYALSVAYGGVPIFIPPWWPFSHYNVRYGLQLLPAFAAALSQSWLPVAA